MSTHTASGRLQRKALEACRRHREAGEIPTSVRFLFYELEQAGILSKVPAGARRPEQNLIDAVKYLREVGLVPWDWIVDDTRKVHFFDGSETVAADLARFLDAAHIDPWGDKVHPFILTESRSLGGVIARTLAPLYRFPVAPTNGQCGGFLVTDIAPYLRDETYRILYLGDFDVAGSSIEENTRRELNKPARRLVER